MNQPEKNGSHQISPENESFEGGFINHVQFAVTTLKQEYGIDNLRDYERKQLEKIFKECLLKFQQGLELARKREMSFDNVAIPHKEAVARWLFELYGIRPPEVHRELTVYASKGDSGAKQGYKIPSGHLQEAENKAADLRADGNRTVKIVSGDVDKKFKQYLQILRKRGAIGEDKL